MTRKELIESLEDATVSVALNLLQKSEFLPPRLWEKARLKLQAQMRKATGEPNLIIHVEIPD